jgi:PST family polysaccharide transporter
MGILGYGAWSLIAANIVQACCVLGLGVMITKQSLWPYFRLQEYRDLFRFASADALNNVVNFTAENLPHVVVAKWLSATALGLYNRSFSLMDLPVRYFSFALSSVLFPVFAKMQRDVPRLGRAFLRTISFTALVTIPIFFGMAAVPDVVIGALFGEQWKPGVGTFQILCITGPFMAMMLAFASVSHALGQVFNECSREGVYLVIMSAALCLLLPFGLEGVAFAVTLATFARYLLLAHLSLRLLGVGWKDFFIAQASGYLLGIIASASAYLVSIVGGMFRMSDILQLLIIMPISGAALCATVFLLPTSWFGDLYPWLMERFEIKFPSCLRKLLMLRVSI